jgi:hypothetical protein
MRIPFFDINSDKSSRETQAVGGGKNLSLRLKLLFRGPGPGIIF